MGVMRLDFGIVGLMDFFIRVKMSRNVAFTYNERDKYNYTIYTSDNGLLFNPSGMVTKEPSILIDAQDRVGTKTIRTTSYTFDSKTRNLFFNISIIPDGRDFSRFIPYVSDDFTRANQAVFKYLDSVTKDTNVLVLVEYSGIGGYFPTRIATNASTIKLTLQSSKGSFPNDEMTVNVENPCNVYTVGRSIDNKLTVEADTGRPKSVCTNAMLGRG